MDEEVERTSELESEIDKIQRQEKQLFEDYVSYRIKELDDGRVEKYNKRISMNKSTYGVDSFYLDSEQCLNIRLHNEDEYYYEIRTPVSVFEEIFEKKKYTLF